MFSIGRWAVILGGLLGIALTVALLTLPLMGACGTTTTSVNGGPQVTPSGCTNGNLIEMQGGRLEPVTWAYLLAMTGAAGAAVVLAWRATGAQARAGIVLGLGALLLAGMLLAGFSIGFFYAPAVLFVIVGGLLMALSRSTIPA